MNTKKFTFGQVREIPKNVEETRTIPFIISDESKDRHGTVISIDGWDIEAYNRNPIVGYMHNVMGGGMCEEPDPDFVIGKGFAHIEGSQLIGDTTFEPLEINEMAEKLFRKVIFGSIRSTSVGFIELTSGNYGQGDQGVNQPNETYFIGKRELIEYSIVNIPSNKNALVRSMRDQTAGALAYVRQQLSGKYRLSQIENMRVCDVIALLDGKDVELYNHTPDEIRALLSENAALREQAERLHRYINLKN